MTLDTLPGVVERAARRGEPVCASDVLDRLASGTDEPVVPAHVTATGFDPLDRVLSGGLRTHDLLILGGMPGVGKTVAALQLAAAAARQGRPVVYACYEHSAEVLLSRLLLLELGEQAGNDALVEELSTTRVRDAAATGTGLRRLCEQDAAVAAAAEALRGYAHRMLLVPASGTRTGVAELAALVAAADAPPLLVVDYLQKVAVRPEPPDEPEKVRRITEGLKELALTYEATVVAVTAADRAALDARRVRLHHLRGSSAIAYEADVVVLMNDKFQCVSKVHLAYDAVRAEQHRYWVVFSVEKNRGGPTSVDVEFRKDFVHYRFDPAGGYVHERLVDERIVEE